MTNLLQSSGVLYWKPSANRRNFGDYISELFLERMLVAPRIRASRYRLIGSIIDNENIARDLGEIKDGGSIAYWGCGARENLKIRPDLLERCEFFGVRGPLTRDLLGLPSDTVLGDPGLLMPLIRPAAPAKLRHGKTVCIPHIFEPKSDEELAAITGAELVVRADIPSTLKALAQLVDQITGAEFVLAGAMHAAIIAHAYGVPFAFFDTGHLDIPFKWRDFAASIGIPTVFVDNLQDGRTAYEDLISSKAKRLPLLPLLAACPYFVQPSMLLKAAAHDAGLRVDARLLMAIRSAGFEAKAYGETVERSENLRNERLKAHFEEQDRALSAAREALTDTTGRLEAVQGALARLEQENRDAHEALAEKAAELAEADRRRDRAEMECGRWMADSERLLSDLRALGETSAALSCDLDASRKMMAELGAEFDAQRRALNTELADANAKLARTEAKVAASGAKLESAEARIRALRGDADRLETQLADFAQRVAALDADKVALSQALDESRGRERELRFESRLKDPALPPVRRDGLFAPMKLEWRLARARLAARQSRWADAERRYGQILLGSPQHPRVLVQYGHALKEQGELELAALAYRRASRLPGSDFDLFEHLAFALRATGQATEAIEQEVGRCCEVISPSDRRADRPPTRLASFLSPFMRLAAIRAAKAGDWAGATRKYGGLVSISPGHAPYWVQYGHALKETGRLRDAAQAYATALKLDPVKADAHLQVGHALKLLERRADAEQAYRQAFQLAPSDVSTRRELEWMGKTQPELVKFVLEAGEARLQRPASTPVSGIFDLALAKLAAKRKNWRAAARRYRRLLARASQDWRVWVQLGHALKEQGRLLEAEGAYLHALALKVDDADLHLQLGHILKLRGFREEAAAAYERAKNCDPALEEARREYEAIRGDVGGDKAVAAGSSPRFKSFAASEFALPPADERRRRTSSDGDDARRPPLENDPMLCRKLGLSTRELKILREMKVALDLVA